LFESFIEHDISDDKISQSNFDPFLFYFKEFLFHLNPQLIDHVEKQLLLKKPFDLIYKNFMEAMNEMVSEKLSGIKFKQVELKRKIKIIDLLKLNNLSFLKLNSKTLFFMLS